MSNELSFPPGLVDLPDGRQVRVLDAVELAAFIREANRSQFKAEQALGYALERRRKEDPVPAGPARVQLGLF